MKKTGLNVFTALAAVMLLELSGPSAFAAGGVWNVDADGNWNTSGNWNPVAVPGTAAGDVVGLNTNITAARTVTLNTPATLGVLNLGDPLAPFFGYTLAGSSTLTFNNSGGGALLSQATVGGAADVISVPIILADNLTILNLNGLTMSGVISGSGKNLTKNGAGSLTINGSAVNTYTGTTTVGGGTLVEDFTNLVTPTDLINSNSVLVMNGGTLQIMQQTNTTTSQSFNGVVISNKTGNFIVGTGVGSGALTVNLGTITHQFGGTVDFTNTSSGFITTSTTNDVTGILGSWATMGNRLPSGTGTSSTGTWAANDGSGNIVPYTNYVYQSGAGNTSPNVNNVSNQNWFCGAVNDGANNVTTITNSCTINTLVMSADFGINNGATLTLNGGGIIFYGVSRWILNNNNGNTTGTAKLTSGMPTGELYLHSPMAPRTGADNWEIWPTIIDGPVPTTLIKDGPGMLILANANTYSGGTVINNGSLQIVNNLGTGSGPVTVINPGGQLYLNANDLTVTNNFILNGKTPGGQIMGGNQSGVHTHHLTGKITLNADANVASYWNDKSIEFAGQITGPGGLTFDLNTRDGDGAGGRYVIDNGGNNYAGNTVVNGRVAGGNAYIVSGANNALPVTTTLTLNYADLILMGNNQTLAGLNDTNTTTTMPATVSTTTGTGGPYADQVVNYSATGVTLTINNTSSNSFSGVIGGTVTNTLENNFALTKQGAGIQALAGANNYANGTLISGGTLQIGIGGASGSLAGIVTNNSVLAFNRSDTSTFANQIVGTGSVAQNSASGGIVTLSGANSYGATIVNSGALWITNTTTTTGVSVKSGGSFGGPGTVAGNVAWQAGSYGSFLLSTNYSVTGSNSTPFTVSGTVALSNNPVTINVVGTPLQPGVYTLMKYTSAGSTGSFITNGGPAFTGAGVALGTYSTITTGGGVVTLTVTVAPTATWINTVSGIWSQGANWSSNPRVPHAVSDVAVLGFGSGLTTVTLDAPETVGLLTFSNNNSFVIANAGNTLTLDNFGVGASVIVTGGTANSIATAVSLNDSATVNVSSSQSLAISGAISSTSAAKTLTVSGPGTLALSGGNSYGPAAGTVGTTLSGGAILQLGNNNALGSGDLSLMASGTVQAGGTVNLPNNVVINSGAVATLDANGYSVTLSGVVSGPGALTKIGAGTLALAGTNTYASGTLISGGTLQIGNGGASGSIVGVVTNNSVLAFNRSDTSFFTNQIVGTGSVVQNSAGSGIVILSATNSYGATVVNSGTLWITNSTTTTGVTVNSGGGFGGPGTVAGSVAWQAGSSGSFVLTASFSATGSNSTPFTVSGTVALSNNPVTINVANAPLQPGTYTLMKYTSAGSTGSFITNGVPTYTGAGVAPTAISTITTGGGTVILTVTAPTSTWTNNVGSSIWSQGTNWNSNPRVPHSAGDVAVFGVGSGPTTVTLDAPETVGVLTFSNNNSFAIANAGNTLTLDNFGAGAFVNVTGGTANSIATAVSLNDKANFNVSSNQSLAISGAISSTSAAKTLTVSGPGTLALSGNNSYGPAAGTVGTTLSGGAILRLGSNSALGSGDLNLTASGTVQGGGTVNVANNVVINSGAVATLDANGNAVTLSGVVSGAGALTKAGAGALTLPNTNTYTGATTVNGGTMVVPTNGVINSTAGTYQMNVGSASGTGVLNISGGTVNAGNGTAYLGGVNVGTGTNSVGVINLSSGQIKINSGQLLLGTGGNGVTSFGALNMSGGSIYCAAGLTLARAATATGNDNGELIVSGGSITVVGGGTGGAQLSIAGYQNANTLSVATLTGGTIFSGVNTYVGEANSGGGRGVLNISGNALLALTNTSAVFELGVNAGGSGIVNLNGGTLVAPMVFKGAGANGYPSYFNFNGGTLKFNASATNAYSANLASSMNNLDGAYVWGGGAIIDGSGTNVIIPQALLAPTGNGVGLGNLAFGGSGFAAPPIVDISGSGTGATAIAMIDGNGNLTNVMITCPGVNYTGTPTFTFLGGGGVVTNSGSATTVANASGGLTQLSGGTLEFDGANTYTGSTAINATNLTLGAGGVFGGGNYSGNISFSNACTFNYNSTNLQILNGPVTSAGMLTVNVNSGGLLVTSNMNMSGGTATVAQAGVFGGSGTVTGNVLWVWAGFNSAATEEVIVNAVAGTNSTPLKIVGTATLGSSSGNTIPVIVRVSNVPLPPGSYILTTCSSGFAGGGTFASTPVYAGAGAAPGTTSVITTDTVNGVAVLTVTYNGPVSGWTNNIGGKWAGGTNWNSNPYVPHTAGDVALLGAGTSNITVTLDASESVGVVEFTNKNSFKIADAGNTLTLDYSGSGATISVVAGTSNSIGTAVSLNDNASVQLINGSSLSMTNVITGPNKTLNVSGLNGGGTLVLSGNNTYGPSYSYSGNPGTTLNGATLQLLNNNALSVGDLNVAGNGTVQAASGINVPNNVNIPASIITVDTTNNAFTLSGNIGDSGYPGALAKVGSGTLTLAGSSSFSGGATVGAGTLQIASGQALGSGTTTVATNALLDLNGQTINVPVTLSGGGRLGNYNGTQAQDGSTVYGMPRSIAYLTGTGSMQLSQMAVNGTGTFDITNLNSGTLDLNGALDNTNLNLHTEAGTTVWLDKSSLTNVHSVNSLWIDGGLVKLNGSGAGSGGDQINDAGTLAMSNAGTLDLNGNSETVGFLLGSGLVTNSNPSTAVTFQVGGGNANTTGAGTFSGLIADGGAATLNFYKDGSGVTSLTGTNTFSGPTTIANGTLSIDVSGLLGKGNYAGIVYNHGTLNYNSAVPQTMSGLIDGTGTNMLGTNASTLTLSGWNVAYVGASIVNGGILKAGSGMAFGTGTVTVNGPGTLDLNGQAVTNAVQLNNGARLINSSGSASANWATVTVAAGSSNIITGVGNMYLQQLTSSGGPVYVTNSLTGTLDIGGTNDNNSMNLITLGGTVLLDKNGTNAGVRAVESLEIDGGLVQLAGTNGDEIFDSFKPLTINGGTLDMNGKTESVSGLAGSGGVISNGFASTPGTLIVLGTTVTNSSSLQNGAGVLNFAKNGGGVQTLFGVNTFTGTAQVYGGGSLKVTNVSTALGSVSGIVLGGGGASGTNGSVGTLLYTGPGEISGRVISFTATNAGAGQIVDQSGTGLLKFTGNLANTGTVTNTLTLQGSTAGNGEIAGIIPNGPLNTNLTSLVKAGTGTWTLSGTNTATGTATVNSGTLQLQGNGSTNWAGSIVVNSGATLGALGSTPTVASNINWTAGSSAALTLNWTGSANTALLKVGGTVALNNNSITVTLGTAVGTGAYPLMTYNAGSIGSFNAANLTIIGPALPANSVATFAVNGGILNLVVRTVDVWTNNGNGAWNVGANWNSNPAYPQNVGDGAIFGAGTGLTTVNLAGNKTVGSIAFTNVNSFVITNSASSLTMDNGGNGVIISVTAGTSNAIAAPVIVNDYATLNVAGAQALALSGSVAGNGGLIVGGAGTASLGGSNTYSGVTTVNAGTLALGATNAISTNSLVMNGGSLDSSVPNLVNGKNNPQSWNGSFGFVGSQNLNLGAGNVVLTNAGVTVTVNSNTLAVAGNISGAGGLTVKGTNNGVLELDGTNTFAWFTNVSGTVALGSDAALGTNATIQLSPVQGVTSVTFKSKDATTHTVTNNVSLNTYDGPYVMGGTGNLVFSGTMATGNGQKRFTVNNYTTFSGPVTDGGAPTNAIIKDGTGTLALTANNTSTKNWTLNGGTLAFGNSGALGLGVLTISNGGLDAIVGNLVLTNAEVWGGNFYFAGSQSMNMGTNRVTVSAPTTITVSNNVLTNAGPINLVSQLTKSGPGKLVLSGINTNNGGVTLNAGTLTISGPNPTAVFGTGTLTINGGNLDVTANNTDSNTNAMVWNGSFGFVSTAGALDLGYGAVTMNTNITITNSSSVRSFTVRGNISGPGYSLTKAGPGSVLLYGTNNYGNTIVNGGTLSIYQPTLNANSTVSIVTGTLSLQFTPATTTNVVAALILAGVSQPAGTYKYANGYLQVVPPPVGPTGPGYLTNLLSGTTMNLSWPGGQGWRLQAQTNDLNSGISNNWVYVNNLTDGSYSAIVNPTNPSVFYRLTYP